MEREQARSLPPLISHHRKHVSFPRHVMVVQRLFPITDASLTSPLGKGAGSQGPLCCGPLTSPRTCECSGVQILGRLLGEVAHGLTSLLLTLQLEGLLGKVATPTSVSHRGCPVVFHCQRFAPELALPAASPLPPPHLGCLIALVVERVSAFLFQFGNISLVLQAPSH